MIADVTPEMVAAYRAAASTRAIQGAAVGQVDLDDVVRAGLVAALAVAPEPVTRCHDCNRAARVLTEWREADGTTVWLGPGCRRRRAERGQGVTLPIGGTP